ncbi:hypothetical protein DPMN_115022 [Dreissena polymorpha]|uniref:Uncharacterized protein n=1 Tax=Dreissena polymorpha TaxID=45954 RepID=A0A9D4KM32_DREPO|nr:hypothetical protein DPMN_115022 [Dreissena polymorpha]
MRNDDTDILRQSDLILGIDIQSFTLPIQLEHGLSPTVVSGDNPNQANFLRLKSCSGRTRVAYQSSEALMRKGLYPAFWVRMKHYGGLVVSFRCGEADRAARLKPAPSDFRCGRHDNSYWNHPMTVMTNLTF